MKTPLWTSIAVAGASLLLGSCMDSGGGGIALQANPGARATLPVFDVTQAGANSAQVEGLYESLGLPRDKDARIAEWHDVVSYVDPEHFLAIPTHAVTDSGRLEKLREMSRGELPDAAIRFDAIDFEALGKVTVLDPDSALKTAAAAFASAGIHLEAATPTVGNTVLTADYTDDGGTAVHVDQKLDTRVSYRFTAANGIPFTGPGAQVQVTFNGKRKVTQLFYAWREVKEGESVKVIPEAEARERIARLLPAGSRIAMRLVYWCPPIESAASTERAQDAAPAVGPVSLIPWYSFTGSLPATDATGRVPGATTRERLIPATDDPRYVPSIQLKVSGSGTTQVQASVTATGGRAPYAYVWSASSPEVLANRTASVSYAPLARVVPSTIGPNETVATNESLSVTVIDANGIAVTASQTLPVQARQIVPEPRGKSHGSDASFGCESPAEPEEWTQERVGWQQGMANPGGGAQEFLWRGDDSWPGDYIRPPTPGSLPPTPWTYGDADYSNWGINTANLVLINGDGSPNWLTAMFPGAPQSDYNSNVYLWRPANPGGTVQLPSGFTTVDYHGSWGTRGPTDRLYWLAGLLCDCLDEKVGAGLSPTDRWGPAFGGLHMFTGFASGAAYSAGAFPKAFARNILGVSGPPETILSAWLNASTSTNEGTAAAMGPITTGNVCDIDDYYIGKGSRGPSIPASQITGWWFVHQ